MIKLLNYFSLLNHDDLITRLIMVQTMMSLSNHSVLKLFTGFAIAAFIAWKLTVNKVITNAPAHAAAKIHHDNATRY